MGVTPSSAWRHVGVAHGVSHRWTPAVGPWSSARAPGPLGDPRDQGAPQGLDGRECGSDPVSLGGAMRLLGRRGECDALDGLLASVRAGQSRVLVVRGEAGVGKTALLDYLVERASGCRIARAAGVESELELPFTGVHQLCAPMLDRLEHLPGPQRDSLATAFGLSAGEPPDRFLVGLAVLGLLAEAAEHDPLVCVLDDAQWLDRVSAQALAFVARRLMAERVALVFALREPSGDRDLTGLPELLVRGLGDGDARAVLDSVIRGPLDERVRSRIIAETRGNPLALLELPRGLTPAELAGGFALPNTMRLANRIEQGFLRRLEPLPRADSTTPAHGGGRAGRRRDALVARRSDSRDRGRCGRPGRRGRADPDRRAGPIPSSARALGDLRVELASRAATRARCAGRGDGTGRRSRPSGVASRPCRRRTRRGGGRRAGTLRRPGAVSRRPRGRSRVPGARGHADP